MQPFGARPSTLDPLQDAFQIELRARAEVTPPDESFVPVPASPPIENLEEVLRANGRTGPELESATGMFGRCLIVFRDVFAVVHFRHFLA